MQKVTISCRLDEKAKGRVEKIAKKYNNTPSLVGGTILENLNQKDMERIFFKKDRTLEG